MDESSARIPVVKQPVSLMHTGPTGHNLSTAARERHPVDALQRSGNVTENPYRDLTFVRSMYGSGLAMEMAAERKIAASEKRMGLHRIGGLYEDIVLGNDCTLQFEDFMSLPEHKPELSKAVFHTSMERQLK